MNNSMIYVFIISHLLHVSALSPSSGNLYQISASSMKMMTLPHHVGLSNRRNT